MNEIIFRMIGCNDELVEIIKDFTSRKNIKNSRRKEELLCSLYKIIEEYDFEGTEFNSLKKKLKFLLNDTGIRHSLENGKRSQFILDSMDEWQKDIFYDKIFNLCLTCIFVNENYLSFLPEIKYLADNSNRLQEGSPYIYYDDFGQLLTNPIKIAQDMCWTAWDLPDGKKYIKKKVLIAKKALEYDVDCCDAYVLLSIYAKDEEKLYFIDKAVSSFEKHHKYNYFKKNMGLFYGILETRPYMRALWYKADYLKSIGNIDEANKIYTRMLKLDKNDHLGVREFL